MGKKRILVVDDEKGVLKVLETRLSIAGYDVLLASNGKDAIRLARSEKPDLILLDLVMPEMDGSEVAQELRLDADTRGIPIIFLTCLLKKGEDKEFGLKIASNIFFAKPYTPEKLLLEIERQLQLKK